MINVDFNTKPCMPSKYKTSQSTETLLSFIKVFQNTLRPGIFADRSIRLERQLFGSEILTFQELITSKYPYLSTLTHLLYS